MKVKLTGFRELEAALAELPKATGKGVLRRVAKGALEPMANMAAAKAPREKGKLSFSVAVSEKRTRRAKKKTARQFVGGKWKADASTGIEMAMGPAGGQGALSYATFQEFGTIHMAARPYMRPAWGSGKMVALEYVKANLGAEIQKAADRLARKSARVR